MVTKVKEILKQFNVELDITDEMLNIEINDDSFQTYHTEMDGNNETHVFMKEKKSAGNDATRRVIINPKKQLLISEVEIKNRLKKVVTYYDKQGKICGF